MISSESGLVLPLFGFGTPDVEKLPAPSIASVSGISAAGLHGGIKPDGSGDLAIVDAGEVASAAGVFTANLMAAAPVAVSRNHVKSGTARAIVANSGCANACTGDRGLRDAESMTVATGELLGCDAGDVIVASTGLIGYALPIESITSAIAGARLAEGDEAGHSAARAIMTTDTYPKEAGVRVESGEWAYTVAGMAKGAAMLAPSMATMLAFVISDAHVAPNVLQACLTEAVSATFNRISVDACQSTNDTVVALCTGKSESPPISDMSSPGINAFRASLGEVCATLALMMIHDGEGSTRVARIAVSGAVSEADALLAARAVCGSVLVRCSLYGCDPYWGRIASEVGTSGAAVDPSLLSISYGGHVVAANGVATAHDVAAVTEHMSRPTVEITCDLGLGTESATMFTCDLGPEYIEENKGTS